MAADSTLYIDSYCAINLELNKEGIDDIKFQNYLSAPEYLEVQQRQNDGNTAAYKKTSKIPDHELFKRVADLRYALGQGMAGQEKIYFSKN